MAPLEEGGFLKKGFWRSMAYRLRVVANTKIMAYV
jgi:hypothetical protein